MPDNDSKVSPAWYEGTRKQFLATPRERNIRSTGGTRG